MRALGRCRGLLVGALLAVAAAGAAAEDLAAPSARGVEQPNLTEVTRCLASVAPGGDELLPSCLDVIAAPCKALPETLQISYRQCLERLWFGWLERTGSLAARYDAMLGETEAQSLREGARSAMSYAVLDCKAIADKYPLTDFYHECRLLMTAYVAHLVEFHPRQFLDETEEPT